MKKILLYCFLLLFVSIVIELISYAGFYIAKGESFSIKAYQTRRNIISETSDVQGLIEPYNTGYRVKREKKLEVIHPYLGYVIDPSTVTGTSKYGFRGTGPTPPIVPKNDNEIIVGVFGGSFAEGTTKGGIQKFLIEQLHLLPQYKNKKIRIQILAMGGYKQPQQLLTLVYFLSLGAHFDIVINIDGFNEVTLPVQENIPKKVFPFYPRNWFIRANSLRDPQILSMLGDIASTVQQRKSWAAFCSNSILRYNLTFNLIWEIYDNYLARLRVVNETKFNNYKFKNKKHTTYQVTGPSFSYEEEIELYKELAIFWRRASEQMHGVCIANGIKYFHFLQPNQYVPDTKIMTEKERAIAISENHPYRKGVELGYPFLIKEGLKLTEAGIQFHDLTEIFSNNSDLLYSDSCCHLNLQGYSLINQRIGMEIVEALKQH